MFNHKNLIQKELEEAKKFMIERDKDNLIILSLKNVAKVEAMIKTDSSYAKSSDVNYKNSSAYFFNELKNEIDKTNNHSKQLKESSNQTIYNIVCAIDRENSTHINADKVGRLEISNRISSLKIKDFLDYLKKPDNLELFNIIAQKTSYSKGEKHRRNPSFASKFCHYACFYLFEGLPEQDNYSIFDSVLKKSLYNYAQKYKINCTQKDLNDYKKYRQIVDDIIKKSNSNISRNGFDHLLWYSNKGRI